MSRQVERWRQAFLADGQKAVQEVLAQRFYLGTLERAQPSEALARMVPAASPQRRRLDASVGGWLQSVWLRPTPDGLTSERFANALIQAFRTVGFAELIDTRAWLRSVWPQGGPWLRGFLFGEATDPEHAFYGALVLNQPDSGLQRLWLALAALRDGRPVYHAATGLSGLRHLPGDGRRPHPALITGMLAYAEALAHRRPQELAACEQDWLREMAFLGEMIPVSGSAWGRYFGEALRVRPLSAEPKKWLDRAFPEAEKHRTSIKKKSSTKLLPSYDEVKGMVGRVMKREPMENLRPALENYFNRYRKYTLETGDNYHLTRFFNNIGSRILDRDAIWVRELAHEAVRWSPDNFPSWSLLARALVAEGDWRRVQAVYWHARRRFPHDVKSHKQLGHALLERGDTQTAIAVFQEAMRLFPDDVFCYSEYGNALSLDGQLEESAAAYRAAHRQFGDIVSITSLAYVLIDQGRLSEADGAVATALAIDRNHPYIIKVQRLLARARAGEKIPPRAIKPAPTGRDGDPSTLADITGLSFATAPDLGRAVLWRRQGVEGLSRAKSARDSLPAGSIKSIEEGLSLAIRDGWPAAAEFLAVAVGRNGGDGPLRIHRNRAQVRAGQTVDWRYEAARFTRFEPVILTERNQRAPSYPEPDVDDPRAPEEDRLRHWYSLTANREGLRDLAEEDLIAVYQT